MAAKSIISMNHSPLAPWNLELEGKADPNYVPGEDTVIYPDHVVCKIYQRVGKQTILIRVQHGSPERIKADLGADEYALVTWCKNGEYAPGSTL